MTRAIDPDGGVRRTEAIPKGSRVRDFDELADPAKEYVAAVAGGGSPRDPRNVTGLKRGDVVVFTEYFHVG